MDLKKLLEIIKKQLPSDAAVDVKYYEGIFIDSIQIFREDSKKMIGKITKSFGSFNAEFYDSNDSVQTTLSTKDSGNADIILSGIINKLIPLDSNPYWVYLRSNEFGKHFLEYPTKEAAKKVFDKLKASNKVSRALIDEDNVMEYDIETDTIVELSWGHKKENYEEVEFED